MSFQNEEAQDWRGREGSGGFASQRKEAKHYRQEPGKGKTGSLKAFGGSIVPFVWHLDSRIGREYVVVLSRQFVDYSSSYR